MTSQPSRCQTPQATQVLVSPPTADPSRSLILVATKASAMFMITLEPYCY